MAGKKATREDCICSHDRLLPASHFYHMFKRSPPRPHFDGDIDAIAEKLTAPVEGIELNEGIPAGYTYFGQFIAHDLSNQKENENLRHSTLDLDGVYGQSPERLRALTHVKDGKRVFTLGHGDRPEEKDLARDADGHALIPDRRNDFHFVISQLHLAFIEFHRAVQDGLAGDSSSGSPSTDELFERARTEVMFHYQWAIVHDFLWRLCDRELVERLWGTPAKPTEPDDLCVKELGKADSRSDEPLLPYEFVLAGFRVGHAMVRPRTRRDSRSGYELSKGRRIAIFQDVMRNGRHNRLPAKWTIQWDRFLDFGDAHTGPPPQPSRRISPSIIPALANLPHFTIRGSGVSERNLARRTLNAGRTFRIATGQEAAKEVGKIYKTLERRKVEVLDPDHHRFDDPLWFYVLKEAAELGEGKRLGPVGSWIVLSTISRVLLQGPPERSFCGRNWTPSLDSKCDTFGLADIIRHAGRPISHDRWKVEVEAK